MVSTARRIDLDGTLPGGAAYTPDDEDYVSAEERAEILRMFKPAGRQRFSSEAEQREYLRLVGELQRPVPALSGAQLAWLVAGVVALGAITGYAWRLARQARARKDARVKVKSADIRGLDAVIGCRS